MSLDPFSAGFDLVRTALDKFFPDADTELKGKLEQATLEITQAYQIQIEQIKTNQVDAASTSIFVSGARPAAMWVGVITLLYSGIGISFFNWLAACFNLPLLPSVDPSSQEYLLYSLLGLGGYRTFEKLKGVQTNKIK